MKPHPNPHPPAIEAELGKVLQTLLFDLPIQPHDLASKLGKPYTTLMREVNPMDGSAKLGIGTVFHIMKITGDTSPLDYMAEQMGYKLIRN